MLGAGSILRCPKCNRLIRWTDAITFHRTFTNRNDLMDLYAKVHEDGKWIQFEDYSSDKWGKLYPYMMKTAKIISFTPWRFCLNGEGYEERCRAVAEFYGWNEQRDPVIDKNSAAYGDRNEYSKLRKF